MVVAWKQPTRDEIFVCLTSLIKRSGEDRLQGRPVPLRGRAWQAYPPVEEGKGKGR